MLRKYLTFWTQAFDSNSTTDVSTYRVIFMTHTIFFTLSMALLSRIPIKVTAAQSSAFTCFTARGVIGMSLLVLYILSFVPTLTLTLRRLRDMSNPSWKIILLFVPIVNLYFAFKLLTVKGNTATSETNGLGKIKSYQEATLDNFAETAFKPLAENKIVSGNRKSDRAKNKFSLPGLLDKARMSLQPILIKLGLIRKSESGNLADIREDINHDNVINVDKGTDNFKIKVKAPSKDPLYMKVVTKKELVWLEELRYTIPEQRILAKNRARFFAISALGVIFGLLGIGDSKFLIGGSLLFAGVIFYDRHSRLKKEYQTYLFDKQVQFSKFTRTVVPYLMNQQGYSFYEVLKKISHRMRIEAAYSDIDGAAVFVADNLVDIDDDEHELIGFTEGLEYEDSEDSTLFSLETMPERLDSEEDIANAPINMFDFSEFTQTLTDGSLVDSDNSNASIDGVTSTEHTHDSIDEGDVI